MIGHIDICIGQIISVSDKPSTITGIRNWDRSENDVNNGKSFRYWSKRDTILGIWDRKKN